jgi:hypothetical protein
MEKGVSHGILKLEVNSHQSIYSCQREVIEIFEEKIEFQN